MTLEPSALLVDSWAANLNQYSDQDGVVNYSIAINTGDFSRRNLGVSTQEANFIKQVFRRLDSLTGLSFQETSSDLADIVFFSVDGYRDEDTVAQAKDNGSQFIVTWKNYEGENLTRYEKANIRHEIGHALGLSHPYGDGWHEGVSTLDTIMSYNEVDYIVTRYSQADIQALQSLWGIHST